MTPIVSLAFAIWSAMVTWVPPSDQTKAWREPESEAVGRYWDIAELIATVSLDPNEEPLPIANEEGEARRRTAFILASVASFEGAYAKNIAECTRLGLGKARGLWQCEGGARACPDVCTDLEHQARLALKMVRDSFAWCAGLSLLDRLGAYTDGKCISDWPRSRNRIGRAVMAWRGAGVL